MSALIRTFVVRVFASLRDFWLMAGVCVALVILAEAAYRTQSSVRDRMAARPEAAARPDAAPVIHPATSQAWYPEFSREFQESTHLSWRPYVYFRRRGAYTGRYVNVDADRHRVTPQPSVPAVPAARVFFFGGSTMWGSFLRDSGTVAAQASLRLQTAAGSNHRIAVTNFGETGHTSTQGMLELILQLRQGNRPDVVVFFDGINDVFSEIQNGEAGYGLNEGSRADEFARGRELSWQQHEPGVVRDLHTYWVLGVSQLKQLHLVKRLQRAVKPIADPVRPEVAVSALNVAKVYVENVRIIEALGRTYGFTPMYVWQPTLHASDKVFTPFEQRLIAGVKSDPIQTRLAEMHRAILPMLDSMVPAVAPGRFVNEGRLFKGDTIPVFTDKVGHNAEQAIPVIVDAFWPTLKSVLPKSANSQIVVMR